MSCPLGFLSRVLLAGVALGASVLHAQVRFSEIMYHPVEEAAFNPDGTPFLDLTSDVHEFLELHNPGAAVVVIGGWKITGGVEYTFPPGTRVEPGQFLVVAKDKTRLAAVTDYQLKESALHGPYEGQLSNQGETLRLRNASDELVDSVPYSSVFPWAISADALGADEEWTGLKNRDYQYRGRSLERVSYTHPANDPANWLASPIPSNPSPGRANAIRRAQPLPIVTTLSVYQDSDEQRLIRHNQPARIDASFSASNELGAVEIEYFVDDIDAANEPIAALAMSAVGDAVNVRFTRLLPGQPDRSVVRYRVVATRAGQREVVSPRADDPFAWHAYFVTPVRTASVPTYDCFLSAASYSRLNSNINGSPRRVTSPDPPGNPRVAWNATEPAVFVHDGIVRDIRMRHHGSRYNRNPNRNSFKWFFPRYNQYLDTDAIFETDKGNDFVVGHGLFINAGLPVSGVRYVDLYINNAPVMRRLEQGEFNGDLLDAYHLAQQKLYPGSALEPSGEIYKSVGTIDLNGEGPYGRGDGRRLSKLPTWSALKMYEWTYSQQNSGWRGHTDFKKMIDAMWLARGDSPSAPKPNISALRDFFTEYFDIDAMLTFLAVENWACPWDDTTQNHFLWRRSNGKWGMLPWDCDAWFGRGDNTPASSSIYIGEVGNANNNFRGPNFFKDGFLKAFRSEYKARLYLLNHTLLHPENITAMGYSSIRSFADARFVAVNQQCGLGVFQRPTKPVNRGPVAGGSAVPNAALRASEYAHSANPPSSHTLTTWEIRRADGTYRAPEFKATSATSLTSLTIPFVELDFGQTYFWRCTYLDAQGHPSFASDETAFTFGSIPGSQTNLVTFISLNAATLWKYNQSGVNLGTAWRERSFDDAPWPVGPALLALETAALPEPIRSPLILGPTTYYFRHHFPYEGPASALLQLRTVLDDGAVVYLNGREVWRNRINGSPPLFTTFANTAVGDAVYEGPFDVPVTNLVSGDNVLAVEVHQSSAGSTDVVFGLSLAARTITTLSGDVVLNEVLANNRTAVAHAGSFPDYVELFNTSERTVDLTGFSLSDNVNNPEKYIFPNGTKIAARGYLLVWCDKALGLPGLHTGFALDAASQTLALFAPSTDGTVVKDSLVFGPQASDLALGRSAEGALPWQPNQPTPEAPNRAQSTAALAGVRINEWLASPDSGEDWFELYNPHPLPVLLGGHFLTGDLTELRQSLIPSLSVIAAHGYQRFIADGNGDLGADHVDFKLSAGGDTIALVSSNRNVIDFVTFLQQATDVSEGRLPDGTAIIVRFPATPSPAEPNYLPLTNIVINEILSHSQVPAEDAIELLNLSSSTVDMSGWYLSDDRFLPRKYRLPAGTIINSDGFTVLYEQQFSVGDEWTGFALKPAQGDDVVLSATDAAGLLTGYRALARLGAAFNGVSFGRFVTSTGVDYVPMSRLSFGGEPFSTLEEFRTGTGQANTYPRIHPLAITEIMYRPPDQIVGGVTNDNIAHEYVELRNTSPLAVDLFDPDRPTNTWRIRGGIVLDFPQGLTVPPGAQLLLVSFAATNTSALESFGTAYPHSVGSRVVGPYSGKLANSRDRIELQQPDIPDPELAAPGEESVVPYVVVDQVGYTDSVPWPSAADGKGPSLHRINPALYGNDPANWHAAPPTPGRTGTEPSAQDSDGDGLPDSWEDTYGLDRRNPADAALDLDNDGFTNHQEFAAGTDPKDPQSRLWLQATRQVISGTRQIRLQFPAVAGRTYVLEYFDELAIGNWVNLGSGTSPVVAGLISITDILPTGFGQRYYRVRAL